MNIYLNIVFWVVLFVLAIGLLLWVFLIRSRIDRKLNMRDALLSSEEFEGHAKTTATEHTVRKRRNYFNSPVVWMNQNYKIILSAYKELNTDIQKKYAVPPAAEWLLDNFYIIEEQVKSIRRDLDLKSYFKLPVLSFGFLKGYARIFAVAVEISMHTDGQINERVVSDYLKAYQSHNILFEREIWALPLVIRLALIDSIKHECQRIRDAKANWRKADKAFEAWMTGDCKDPNCIMKIYKDSFAHLKEVNSSFLDQLFYRLRRSGNNYSEVNAAMEEFHSKLGLSVSQIIRQEHNVRSANTVTLGNCVTSLRLISTLDWGNLLDNVSFVEKILRTDPDGTYPLMDTYSRNFYRSKIEKLANAYRVSELYIAKEAIRLAKEAFAGEHGESADNPSILRTFHVGYYIVGKGVKALENRQEKNNKFVPESALTIKKYPAVLYLLPIALITFILTFAAVRFSLFFANDYRWVLSVLAGIAVLIPSSEIAVHLVNRIVCRTLPPAFFSRLELKEGIPSEMSTVVAIPTLLNDTKRVNEILDSMEGHYLSNREKNLYFALLGAFKDADKKDMTGDSEIVAAALHGVKALNDKYAPDSTEIFYFFHRERQFNESNNTWISWERKRGTLLEFNDLVLGCEDTSFTYFSSHNPPFQKVRYIITLDCDTVLPLGMAKKMVGVMAHPLNRPIIDLQKNIVVEGYGVIQPRVEVDVESANASLFARILTGQKGIDPYANAISDVYQDLFGEGIFIGKGIYDLRAFQTVLKDHIPLNSILSHDLLEGSFIRAGLVTNLKLVDSYPSKYNSYSARQHRWVRGDWQLVPFLFRRIKNSRGETTPNPISLLSKVKMFDNLRRSLIAPSLIVLLLLSLSVLPGSIFFWIVYFILALSLPLVIDIVNYLFSRKMFSLKVKRYTNSITGLWAVILQNFLKIAFLPYQALLMVNAICVTLARVFITKKNMLEWVTAADAEKTQKNTFVSYLHMMWFSLVMAFSVVLLSVFIKPQAFLFSLILFTVWVVSPYIAFRISKETKEYKYVITEKERLELGMISRKTWRYFEEFANARNNFLAPDNYQVDPPKAVAHRTSPTNIGLGLLATLSAADFGYIGIFEMVEAIDKTISTIESMAKWKGHLYNWYDTQTLETLHPEYVSTVDSGNLAGYLITLSQGLREYLGRPLIGKSRIFGLRDTLCCAEKEDVHECGNFDFLGIPFNDEPLNVIEWSRLLDKFEDASWYADKSDAVWKEKIEYFLKMAKNEILDFYPCINFFEKMPESMSNTDSGEKVKSLLNLLSKNVSPGELQKTYKSAEHNTIDLIDGMGNFDNKNSPDFTEWLSELKGNLHLAFEKIEQFKRKTINLIERVDALTNAMEFTHLYDKERQLFSIGFSVSENKISNSYYDLFASEARQASYICIAKGMVPASHWFKMGRALTVVDHYKGLISWTGTMFEYYMPLLIMKTYKNTLLDETYSFVIKCQKDYANQRQMPWGVSESGFNSLDINHDYQYKAIGVPSLGLKRGLIEDAVVAPYATFLALAVAPEEALKNISLLQSEGLNGPYGFYEAADYTKERLPFEKKRAIVKSFMAHHVGMSLLSLDNFIFGNIMQERFHRDREMNSAKLLLQEKIPDNLIFTKEVKEKLMPFKGLGYKEIRPMRKFNQPDPILPNVHILSNGNYSVMISDKGTGFSKNKLIAVTRWRSDSTIDQYGMFFYLRNVDTDKTWSSTYAPLNVMPEQYEVTFTDDKATFTRMDGQIKTETEIIVTTGDNAEIRRLTLKNFGDKPCTIDITSYLEVVLAPQSSDLAHPAFSNLFVETEFIADKRLIVAGRRPRSKREKGVWMANTAIVEGELIGNVSFETDRAKVIGRGNNVKKPIIIESGKQLANTAGSVLDPVISIRATVRINPKESAKISFITATSDSEEILLEVMNKYKKTDSIEGAFRLAFASSQVETKYRGVKAEDIELYQSMISDILFISPRRIRYKDLIEKNSKGQSSLWKYGVSGDLPIVLITLDNAENLKILTETLKARDYWMLMDIRVDLVILSSEDQSYFLPLHSRVSEIVEANQTSAIFNDIKGIYILDKNQVPQEDIWLFSAVASIMLKSDGRRLSEQWGVLNEKSLPEKTQFKEPLKELYISSEVESKLAFFNGTGGFSNDGKEYVIRLGKGENTPAPWINVIANPTFGFTVSESGSGFSWFGNSRENKLTPWSNDAVSDRPGEVIYLSDSDTGEVWTTTCLPIRDENAYTITHGFGYSIFEHSCHGIKQRLTQHVDVQDCIKISIASIKNTTGERKNLRLTYYVKPVLGVSDQSSALHIRTSTAESGCLMIENPYNEEYPGHICFLDTSQDERTVTGDGKEFFGTGDIELPECLQRESLSGNVGAGLNSCAAIQIKVSLEPNESKDIVLTLGTASNKVQAEELALKYRDAKTAIDSLLKAKSFWSGKLEVIQVDTPSKAMDFMLNGWLPYQVTVCRLWARSAFYQSGGAFGFRDQLQDCLSLAKTSPTLARDQILLHAKHQFLQGDVQHWWHEPRGYGTRTRISDDRLWLPYVIAEYISITGDSKILAEELSFIDEDLLAQSEDERYSKPRVSDIEETLFEHCIRAIEVSLKLGNHGLPLFGSGDWNDGMNTVGNLGKGESVWLGWFLITVLDNFIPLCKLMKRKDLVDKYTIVKEEVAKAIEENAWDGEWYLRAYFDNGKPLGSAQNTDCKIDSISQSWSVISGAANPKRATAAMASLEENLVSREDGIIKLLSPPFDQGDSEPGYIKGYIPGVRENGGQYSHAAVWAVIAYAKLGDGDKAWALFDLINPINHSDSVREQARYKVEPYVMAADVYAAYPHAGRGGWSWYTGAASWMHTAGIENILGFKKMGETLFIEPCVPKAWKEYSIKYKYMNTMYDIKVKNPDGISKGVKRISVDQIVSTGNQINLMDDGKDHHVEVVMGI